MPLESQALPVASRPGYGGLCYSEISDFHKITAVSWNASSVPASTTISDWVSGSSETTVTVYAHPIDGFLPEDAEGASENCPVSTATSSSYSYRERRTTTTDSGYHSDPTGYTYTNNYSPVSNDKNKNVSARIGYALGALLVTGLIAGLLLVWGKSRRAEKKKEKCKCCGKIGGHHGGDGGARTNNTGAGTAIPLATMGNRQNEHSSENDEQLPSYSEAVPATQPASTATGAAGSAFSTTPALTTPAATAVLGSTPIGSRRSV